jgi:hypothetical protein
LVSYQIKKSFTQILLQRGTLMPKIFNTEIDYDGYETLLTQWEGLPDSEDYFEEKAMVVNIRCDPRVSEKREQKFRDEFFEPHQKIIKAFEDHRDKKIRWIVNPEFCEAYCDNVIADCSTSNGEHCENFDKNIDLATVINLNGYRRPIMDSNSEIKNDLLEWSEYNDIDLQTTYTETVITEIGETIIERTGFDIWLDNYLENKTSDEKKSFIEFIFKLLETRMSEGKYFHPSWVTNWKYFEPFIKMKRVDGSLNIDIWNQIVGIPRNPLSWQIVVKYPADVVKCLYRPSVLDGGCMYPQHFPSPPVAPMAVGGHTMDLGTSASDLLPEFIHTQIPLKIEYWVDAGSLIGQTFLADYTKKLKENRGNHYEKLTHKYYAGDKNEIKKWMSSPM